MKVRFYPKKAAFVQFLNDRMVELEAEVEELNKSLEKKKESKLYDPSGEADRYAELIDINNKTIALMKKKVQLLESHTPPEVMVEWNLSGE